MLKTQVVCENHSAILKGSELSGKPGVYQSLDDSDSFAIVMDNGIITVNRKIGQVGIVNQEPTLDIPETGLSKNYVVYNRALILTFSNQ